MFRAMVKVIGELFAVLPSLLGRDRWILGRSWWAGAWRLIQYGIQGELSHQRSGLPRK